jgi:secreted trypsin-like serine protease
LGEFPHQALLGYNRGNSWEWQCGGSLVSPDFVMTAAHCLRVNELGPVKFVKLGINSRTQKDNYTQRITVAEIIQHPSYDGKYNDIGLLRLKRPATLNEHVIPICMPQVLHEPHKGIVTGFGITGYMQNESTKLLKVTLERFPYDECQRIYNGTKIEKDSMLCFGHHTEKKDSCNVRNVF